MRLVGALLSASLLTLTVAPTAVFAQLTAMTTPFPAVVADPGATAAFNVTVTTDVSERVDLSVVSQPEGWTTSLRGGGSTVSAVFTAPNAEQGGRIMAEFTAEVVVPEDAPAGANQVVLEGRSASGTTQQLTLDITIEALDEGSITMTTDFPDRSGTADDEFSVDLEVRNSTNQQVTLSFQAEGPAGWRVSARPSGDSDASTAVVDAGGLSSATITIDPPDDAPAGTYTVIARAVGGPQPVETELGIEITGSFAMAMNTDDNRLSTNLTVGGSSQVNVVIVNEGSAPLENVALTSTPPRNWTVAFATETIPVIEPGSQETVPVTITSAGNAVAGDYVVTLRARAGDLNENIEIRTTVESSPVGGLIGIAVLAIVAIGLFFVFQRYGRR
jgi:uncharacterized membrane protein